MKRKSDKIYLFYLVFVVTLPLVFFPPPGLAIEYTQIDYPGVYSRVGKHDFLDTRGTAPHAPPCVWIDWSGKILEEGILEELNLHSTYHLKRKKSIEASAEIGFT